MKKLVFPRVAEPEVTVVVVTYGAARWVRRCLSALIARTDPCYEVIVVDNASPGAFGQRLSEELENAWLVRNPVNRGFGPANNQAANLARGAQLLFLNSDVLVHPDWLVALRDALSRRPDAAAVAPRILNLDGTLQEAGALLFSNGYTQFYGFGDDPDRPKYRFAREVDYASAACLLVRRDAFFEVGGFDPVYAPAYYEDVDLCLSLRERGYRILYEPRAVVAHARGASSSPTLAVRLWKRNHPLFVRRWKALLRSRPEHTPPDGGNPRLLIAARDAPAPAKILLLADALTAHGGSSPDPTRELARIAPDALRTIVSAGPPDPAVAARLASEDWEVADPGAISERVFHYDVVVFAGPAAVALFGAGVEETQPQAVRITADETTDLEPALVRAGIPPSERTETAAWSRAFEGDEPLG